MQHRFLIAALILMLAGCKVIKPIAPVSSSSSMEIEYIHDSIAFALPDSASIKALAACDSLGNVYIKQIVSLTTGRNTRPDFHVKDNYIMLRCKVDSAAVFVKMSSRYKSTSDTLRMPVAVEVLAYKDKPLSWFQKTIQFAGYLFFAELLIAILYFFYRIRKSLNPL